MDDRRRVVANRLQEIEVLITDHRRKTDDKRSTFVIARELGVYREREALIREQRGIKPLLTDYRVCVHRLTAIGAGCGKPTTPIYTGPGRKEERWFEDWKTAIRYMLEYAPNGELRQFNGMLKYDLPTIEEKRFERYVTHHLWVYLSDVPESERKEAEQYADTMMRLGEMRRATDRRPLGWNGPPRPEKDANP